MRTGLAAVFAAASLAAACGQQSTAPRSEPAPQAGAQAPGAAPRPAPVDQSAAIGAVLAGLPAPYNEANYDNGKRQFAKCRSCHTIVSGGAVMQGPPLHGVFGRKIGTYPDFKYSPAVTAATFTWSAEELDKWLTDPRGYLPGNRMSFAGIPDAEDRRDLIAFIKVESAKP